MRTLKQIEASRANGAKSQGPKTPQTRAISAVNSLKHGFNAKNIVLQNENPLAWQQHLQAYLDQFEPATKPEEDLVLEVAGACWRLRRLLKIETATLDLAMDRQAPEIAKKFETIDEPTRLAFAFQKLADESRSLSLLSRYEVRLRKIYAQALANLLRLQELARARDGVRNEPGGNGVVSIPGSLAA